MPSAAHSTARFFVSWLSAAFVMAYRLPLNNAVGPPGVLTGGKGQEAALVSSTCDCSVMAYRQPYKKTVGPPGP